MLPFYNSGRFFIYFKHAFNSFPRRLAFVKRIPFFNFFLCHTKCINNQYIAVVCLFQLYSCVVHTAFFWHIYITVFEFGFLSLFLWITQKFYFRFSCRRLSLFFVFCTGYLSWLLLWWRAPSRHNPILLRPHVHTRSAIVGVHLHFFLFASVWQAPPATRRNVLCRMCHILNGVVSGPLLERHANFGRLPNNPKHYSLIPN